MASDQPLRWGIVSTARINDNVLPGLRQAERAELVAVASRDLDRARAYAASKGIPQAYGSYAELFADEEIDCVYISVPNSEHVSVAAEALAAGKHVLCEKPLATSRDQAAELFQRAQAADRVLMEAFMYRHHDKARKLRDLVQSGELGDIQAIRSRFHFRVDEPEGDIRYRPELGGGALRDVGCYCTSLATFLIGEAPVAVHGSARLASSGVEQAFSGLLGFADGTSYVFDCGMQSDLDIGVSILGTKGRAELATPWYPHLAPAEIEVWRDGDRSVIPTSTDDPYQLEVENFCAAVDGDRPPEVTPEETLRNLGLLDELAAAARLPNYTIEVKGPAPS
jgi:D-xylose 1-dehydrogenase (NADP+, D-xylono-1,5-lactone-forming)